MPHINRPDEPVSREYLIAVLLDRYKGLSRTDAEDLADREEATDFVDRVLRDDPSAPGAPKRDGRADSRRVYREDSRATRGRGGMW